MVDLAYVMCCLLRLVTEISGRTTGRRSFTRHPHTHKKELHKEEQIKKLR